MKLNQMNQSHNPDKQKVGELIMLCYVTISLIYKEKPTIKFLDLTLIIIITRGTRGYIRFIKTSDITLVPCYNLNVYIYIYIMVIFPRTKIVRVLVYSI